MSQDTTLVAMSGGVDSSVAAALLQQQGRQILGATLTLDDRRQEYQTAVADARRVCRHLGIEHHVVDARGAFEQRIIQPFVEEYLNGRTPNPCIRCNALIKFGILLDFARQHHCAKLATGHYARLVFDEHWRLLRGTDREKDQSYFLFLLDQEEMAQLDFPLGTMTKEHIRQLAADFSLPVAQREESQETCFVPDNDIGRYIDAVAPKRIAAGEIVDCEGNVLGRHQGIHRYTVGQRRGLGVAAGEPLYVVRIDRRNNRLIIGPRDALERENGTVDQLHWCAGNAPSGNEFSVQIRYRHPGVPSTITRNGDRGTVQFHEKVRGWTPGQAAVFYRNDEVIGGGWIVADEDE